MRIVVDLDGVVLSLPDESKGEGILNQKMKEFLIERKRLGDYIVIFSSNGMNTYKNDLGKVYTNRYVKIYNLLVQNGIPFDELILGKPNADIYIDDKAIRYSSIMDLKLPTFIITAAGQGKRTKSISDLPKPIIPVLGKPLIYWAFKSLPLDIANKIVFLYRDDRVQDIAKEVLVDLGYNKYFIDQKFVPVKISELTRGQAETAIHAKQHVNHESIIIYNIDTYFKSYYMKSKLLTFSNEYDGIIGCFRSDNPGMSYVKVQDRRVVDVEEKKKISDIATTGLYGFRNFDTLYKYYSKYSEEVAARYGEIYIAPLYKYMIEDGMNITYDIAEICYPIGTKEEVLIFEREFQP